MIIKNEKESTLKSSISPIIFHETFPAVSKLCKKMLDIENETGMVWVEIARACYSTYAAVAEDRHNNSLPNWNELPLEDQIAWECAVRQIETLTNGLPGEADYWKKFAQRRLNNKKR